MVPFLCVDGDAMGTAVVLWSDHSSPFDRVELWLWGVVPVHTCDLVVLWDDDVLCGMASFERGAARGGSGCRPAMDGVVSLDLFVQVPNRVDGVRALNWLIVFEFVQELIEEVAQDGCRRGVGALRRS